MIDLILHFGAVVIFALAFLMGVFHERNEWNKLIERGAIPKPTKEIDK